MAVLSDAVVIGTVLGLVFSAVAYYLYTRILQTERKISLMENILLDLKVTTEQALVYSANSHSEPESSGNGIDHEMDNTNTKQENLRDFIVESQPRSPRTSQKVVMEKAEENSDDNQCQSASEQEDEEPFVPAVDVKSATSVTSKMSPTYESMTYKDLIVEGRKRKVVGYSHMSKAELCAALRRQDNGEPPLNRRGSRQEKQQVQTSLQEFTPSVQDKLDNSTAPMAANEVFGDDGLATLEGSSLVA